MSEENGKKLVTKYVWVSDGGEKTCSECEALDGEIFDSLEDVPDSPHPNCQCKVEEIEVEEDEEETEKFEIKETISRYSPANQEDVLNLKTAMQSLGYYEPDPRLGIDVYTDEPLFNGIEKFQADNRLKVDGVMKPKGETISVLNGKIRTLESLSEAGMQGLSLGWSDEIQGVASGFGYSLGSLNKNWNKTGESLKNAYNRGYSKYRDERRNLLEEGYKNTPTAMLVMETAGAIASPVNKLLKKSKTAPLKIKDKINRNTALITGGIYGIGAGEGDFENHVKNAVIGTASAVAGHNIAKNIFGRGNSNLLKETVRETINFNVNNLLNYYDRNTNKK